MDANLVPCFSVPEIEQGLSDASNSKVTISFTPHLMPMVNVLLDSKLVIYLSHFAAFNLMNDISSRMLIHRL